MGEWLFGTIEAPATWLYWECTDFMINSADLAGVTYRDTNSFMFFLLWPGVTALLVVLALWQARDLRRLNRTRRRRARP